MNWNSICVDSMKKEKEEIARRYNIRFGQTEIYCRRCGRPVPNPLNHICQEIQLRKLKKAKSSVKEGPKMDVSLSKGGFGEITPPASS